MRFRAFFLLALLSVAGVASADEIWLKDGTKIQGTIVGFEENSFKVQTSYGFALVRKDRVTAIIPAEAKSDSSAGARLEPKKEPAPEAKKSAAAVPETRKAVPTPRRDVPDAGHPNPVGISDAPVEAGAIKVPTSPQPATPKKNPPAAIPVPSVAPSLTAPLATPPAAQPSAPPTTPPIREEVRGNLYINHTYGFRMFKPPGWRMIEDARTALPAAIMAMGTTDETTLLVIGREKQKDSLEAHAAATEKQLRDIYTNYRRLSAEPARISGLAALERRYRGTVDGHDWSGTMVSVAHNNEVFTILGMTYAESDLIQIQENVITKTIASLDFSAR